MTTPGYGNGDTHRGDDAPQTVTLPMQASATKMLVVMLPILVVAFLLGWFLLTSLLSAIGLPSVLPSVLGALGSLALCVALWRMRKTQLEKEFAETSLVLDHRGILRDNPQGTAEISWRTLQGYAKKDIIAHSRRRTSNPLTTLILKAALFASQRKRVSLVGGGVVRRKPGLNLQNSSIANNIGLPQEGEESALDVHVFLEDFEPDWRNGSIGRFIMYYRPDLGIPPTDDDVPSL